MNYEIQQILGYHLSLYRKLIKNRKHQRIDPYFKSFITRPELVEILNWLLDDPKALAAVDFDNASNEELWEIISDDVVILDYYRERWESQLQHRAATTADGVWETLIQLQHETHYLASKHLASWDTYDCSNYKNLQLKAGHIQKVYGIYDSSIWQDQVDSVTSPPFRYFERYEIAEKALDDLVRTTKCTKDSMHILYAYKAI